MDTATRGDAAGGPQGKPAEKKTFSQKLADFLRKYRIALLVVFALLVAAVIGVAVYSTIHNSRVEASTAKLEKLSDDLGAWSAETDETKKAEQEKALLTGLDELIAAYPRLFAAERALSFRARLAEQRKDWTAAESDWLKIEADFPRSYLAPVALHNAAVAAEEAGSVERAAEHYKKLVDAYTGKAVGIGHAYYSLGRLAEGSKDYAGALANYTKLVSSFPEDDWTKLAKSRIISIRSRGLAK